MTNSRQNTVIIVGLLSIAIIAEVGMLLVPGLPEPTTGALTNLLTGTVGGLIGFLARGPSQNQNSPPDPEAESEKEKQ